MTKLDKLFENFNGDPKDYKVSIDWGNPRGKEVWLYSYINGCLREQVFEALYETLLK